MDTKPPLWADLHNHNEIGYGVGTLKRSLRLARQRLDVWAFTAHAHWDDIPQDWSDVDVQKHLEGFRKVAEAWPSVVETLQAAQGAGGAQNARRAEEAGFLPIAGFEWHSNVHGDRHVLPPQPPSKLPEERTFEALRDFARRTGALLVPHHLAYPPGARGVNWADVDDELSPIAEIFSEHGAAETGDGPWPMDGHSMSPRSTANTWQEGLRRGLHLGAVASTDNHFGCPAAYNEGLTGIWSDTAEVDSVFAALRDRRCFAVTGDRIRLDWQCDGAPMGAVMQSARRSPGSIVCRALGWDVIEQVDLLHNGALVRRWTPGLDVPTGDEEGYVLRARWGWGRMAGDSISHWEVTVTLEDGVFDEIMPGFGSVPPGEASDGEFMREGAQQIRWTSRTSRAFPQPYDQMAFRISGNPLTRVHTTIRCRISDDAEGSGDGVIHEQKASTRLGDLLAHSQEIHVTTPPFTPTFQWTRGLPAGACSVRIEEDLDLPPRIEVDDPPAHLWTRSEECLYVRVRQRNGQMAWSSPIWFAH